MDRDADPRRDVLSDRQGVCPTGVHCSGCPEHGDPWGWRDSNPRRRCRPVYSRDPLSAWVTSPCGGPPRRCLGDASSPPARSAGAMRPDGHRPEGRCAASRSPIEHRSITPGGAGGWCSRAREIRYRVLKDHAHSTAPRGDSCSVLPLSGRWFRFAVQALCWRWSRRSGSARWADRRTGERWAVRPPDAGTETRAGDWYPQAFARFGRLSPRSRRKARE